jgi:hypothetical protein
MRLAMGTALSLAISFGFGWPVPMVAPVLAVFLLGTMNQPLPWRAGAGLALVVGLTTGSGLMLVPFLRHYAASGVMLVTLGLFLAFRYGMRGGNRLVSTFLAAGLTMISAAGTAEGALATTVIGALVRGLLLGVAMLALTHWLWPEPPVARPPAPPARLPEATSTRLALRATLVVMPAYLLALADPATYMPIIMKSVSLGRQSCSTAKGASRELLSSTLLGGLLAVLLWCLLSLFVHLWMFFLWTALLCLLAARRMTNAGPGSAGFWLNTLVTMIILLGQSVQDSAAGKDVYTAFAVRMGLFIAVTLYARLMLWWLDTPSGQPD